jgi:hypothetical protein
MVYDYFTSCTDGYYICKCMKANSDESCGGKVSGFGSSGKTNASSRAGNLKTHLQRYHLKEYEIVQAHDNTKRTEKSQASTSGVQQMMSSFVTSYNNYDKKKASRGMLLNWL